MLERLRCYTENAPDGCTVSQYRTSSVAFHGNERGGKHALGCQVLHCRGISW